MGVLTLSVQEVAHGNCVVATLGFDGGLEHLVGVGLGADAHILLAEMLDMRIDVSPSKLLRERDLLQWHLVDTSTGKAEHRRRHGEDSTLHGCYLSL